MRGIWDNNIKVDLTKAVCGFFVALICPGQGAVEGCCE
jgi:hypothetical protein